MQSKLSRSMALFAGRFWAYAESRDVTRFSPAATILSPNDDENLTWTGAPFWR
jgi:hypothetical protein